MNTREIAEEINKATSTPEMRLKSDVDVIQAILDRHLVGKVLVQREPSDKALNGLARSIMLWMDMNERKTPDNLRAQLKNMGEPIPEWMAEIIATVQGCHVMPKAMRCLLVYKAMIAEEENGD